MGQGFEFYLGFRSVQQWSGACNQGHLFIRWRLIDVCCRCCFVDDVSWWLIRNIWLLVVMMRMHVVFLDRVHRFAVHQWWMRNLSVNRWRCPYLRCSKCRRSAAAANNWWRRAGVISVLRWSRIVIAWSIISRRVVEHFMTTPSWVSWSPLVLNSCWLKLNLI